MSPPNVPTATARRMARTRISGVIAGVIVKVDAAEEDGPAEGPKFCPPPLAARPAAAVTTRGPPPPPPKPSPSSDSIVAVVSAVDSAETPNPACDPEPEDEVEPEVTRLTRGLDGRRRTRPVSVRMALKMTSLCKTNRYSSLPNRL